MLCVHVPLARDGYDVLVGDDLLDRAGELARGVLPGSRAALLADSNVAPLYADRVAGALEAAGIGTLRIVVPAGETSKSLGVAGRICDDMIAGGLDRASSLLALGGGVVGDLGGFVASIYFRGIPYIQIPTTVLAQVDSSVGGKTGVNAAAGKNLLGCFHQPRLVIADTRACASLPSREYASGFAEIIKHAAIRDAAMLDDIRGGRPDDLPALIARNVGIKAAIVAADERETGGLRALLNFGHTIGHAIENAAGYGRFLHGEAIALGLVAATRLSVRVAGLPPASAARIIRCIADCGLPTSLDADIPEGDLLAALRRDKKFLSGGIRFVLLRALGDAFVSEGVTEEAIAGAIRELRSPPDSPA